jgi:hypothetical protein
MNYKAISRSILKNLSSHRPPPEPRKKHSDDARIAQLVWNKMQLQMAFEQSNTLPDKRGLPY